MAGALAVKNEIPVKNEINPLRLLLLKMRIFEEDSHVATRRENNGFAGVTLLKTKTIGGESLDNCQNEFSGTLCYFYGIKTVKCYRVDNWGTPHTPLRIP